MPTRKQYPVAASLPKVTWEMVTPEMATKYLEHNVNNRSITGAHLVRMVQDMRDETWHITHQGIAFDTLGHLVDGQHRLEAVVSSRISQWFLVCRGLDPKAVVALDKHRARTIAHTLQLLGIDQHLSDNRAAAIARRMLLGPVFACGGRILTEACLRDFIVEHSAAILAARSSQQPAYISAVVARAYYHCDLDKLTSIIDLLKSETRQAGSPGEHTIVNFKIWLLKTNKKLASGGWRHGTHMYRTAQVAFAACIENRLLTKFHQSDDDLFPLPPKSPEANPQNRASTPERAGK